MTSAANAALQAARAALLMRERAHAEMLVRMYGAAYVRLQERLSALLAQVQAQRQAGQPVSAAWLYREARYTSLLSGVQSEIDAFSSHAATLIAQQQALAVGQAIQAAPVVMSASLPAYLAGSFSSLPAPAARRIIGNLANGRTLTALLSQIAPLAAASAAQSLVIGIVAGDAPRAVAAHLRSDLGIGLTRALIISRTEVIRAYRDASLDIYRENADVVEEWEWYCALGPKTCAMCIAMHGRRFPLSTPFASHPCCRCVPRPITKDWADLGIPGQQDSRPPSGPKGADWFAQQPEDVQRQILGPAKLAAYKAGSLTLGDLVGYRDDPTWGPTRFERSLKAVKSTSAPASLAASLPPAALTPPVPASPAPPAPPVPPPPPALVPGPSLPENLDWQAKVRAARLPEVRGYAGLRGLTENEYQVKADVHLAHLMKDIRPWLRIRPNRLEEALVDGRFKNRFETNTPGGSLSRQARVDTELAHFDIPDSAPAEDRPIYGYLHLGASRAVGPDTSRAAQYGSVAVRFKPEVLARTTFTVGDTMDETLAGQDHTVAAVPALSPSWIASSPDMGDPLKSPSAPAWLRAVNREAGYVEAQYHGGLDLGDIAEVVLNASPAPSLRQLLRKNKIKWSVVK